MGAFIIVKKMNKKVYLIYKNNDTKGLKFKKQPSWVSIMADYRYDGRNARYDTRYDDAHAETHGAWHATSAYADAPRGSSPDDGRSPGPRDASSETSK